MIMKHFFSITILFRLCGYGTAECKNACSGHGQCSAFDICLCQKNWQANDCSERRCPFGVAWVDTPKGDLDSSGSISGPDEIISVNSELYPYGTTEQFPNMRDSDLNLLEQTGHYYAECSGSGECNRKTGECECADGFDGHACQYIECPGEEFECSAHGTCHKMNTIAQKDYGSKYSIWSQNSLKGCICDKGWYGGDCSLRHCKHGLDPQFTGDDIQTYQVPSFFFTVVTTSATRDFNDGVISGTGYYRIRVFDHVGQGYLSAPIAAGASCTDVVNALQAVPNGLIPTDSLECYSTAFEQKNPLQYDQRSNFEVQYDTLYSFYFGGENGVNSNSKVMNLRTKPAFAEIGYRNAFDLNRSTDVLLTGDLYLLRFRDIIGNIGQPEVDIYSDYSRRPTIGSTGGTVVAKMWTNGQQGASVDYFGDHCDNLRVRVMRAGKGDYFLWGPFVPEVLYECLGHSKWENNTEDEQWNYGSVQNPHPIRLVRHVADPSAGGFFSLLWFDPEVQYWDQSDGTIDSVTNALKKGALRLMHPFHSLDDDDRVEYNIYSSKGKAEMIGPESNAVFKFADNKIYMVNTTYDLRGGKDDGAGFSCEALGISKNAASKDKPCLDKNDLFFVVDPYQNENSPSYLNMYTAVSITTQHTGDANIPYDNAAIESVGQAYNLSTNAQYYYNQSHYKRHVITTDLNTNWAHDAVTSNARFRVYKFTPHPDSTYTYVSECSNRGLCNAFEGVCECFPGYHGDACVNKLDVICE